MSRLAQLRGMLSEGPLLALQAALMLHPSAAAPSVPLLSTPSPRVQASSPFFKPDPDGEGQSGTLPCTLPPAAPGPARDRSTVSPPDTFAGAMAPPSARSPFERKQKRSSRLCSVRRWTSTARAFAEEGMQALKFHAPCAESKAPGGLALGTFPSLFGPSLSGFHSHPQSPSVYMKMPVRLSQHITISHALASPPDCRLLWESVTECCHGSGLLAVCSA